MVNAVWRLVVFVCASPALAFAPLRASLQNMENVLPADVMMQGQYKELASRIEQMAMREAPLWIGIAGCPGSGKTSLSVSVGELLRKAGVLAAVLPMDGFHYYRTQLDEMPDPQAAHARRGAPFTFDVDKMVATLEDIHSRLQSPEIEGELSWPSFDHEAGDPVEGGIVVEVDTKVVLVEGNYLLLSKPEPWDRVRSFFDEMWYIDVDIEVAVERVARRHTRAWGWSYEKAYSRANDSDRTNMELILAEGRDCADLYIQSL